MGHDVEFIRRADNLRGFQSSSTSLVLPTKDIKENRVLILMDDSCIQLSAMSGGVVREDGS